MHYWVVIEWFKHFLASCSVTLSLLFWIAWFLTVVTLRLLLPAVLCCAWLLLYLESVSEQSGPTSDSSCVFKRLKIFITSSFHILYSLSHCKCTSLDIFHRAYYDLVIAKLLYLNGGPNKMLQLNNITFTASHFSFCNCLFSGSRCHLNSYFLFLWFIL